MSTPAVANVGTAIAKTLSGVSTKLILREAIHYSTEKANVSFKKQPTFWIALRLVPIVYPWADTIIAVNPKVAQDIAQVTNISSNKIYSINNPTITQNIFEKAKEPINETWFQEIDTNQHKIILGVGRLTTQKDFPTLVQAFALIRKQYQAKLIILGEGENRNELETLISRLNLIADVILPGFTPNPYAYMAKASVFVLSSAWEGSPNTLVEAMACGTPVVSTDCLSGPREILNNGKYGQLVNVGDYEALADAIIQTLISDNDLDALKTRAKDFSVENIAQQYLKVLLKS
jgi:glycosyltransferase involved in cell wall biosynthesis